MNERTALAVIDRDYGSIEDFAIALLGEKRDALDESLPLARRAEVADVPVTVFARIISSPQFRALLRVDLVNSVYGIEDEREHIMHVGRVARGSMKTVATASGKIAKVDQSPGDVIAAGRYLNELRGTPIEKTQQQAPSIVINIGGAEPGDDRDDAPTIDVDVEPYRPQRAGGLPPRAARARFGTAARGNAIPESHVDSDLGSVYGPNAEEQDEDWKLAQKAKRGEPVEEEKVDDRVFSRAIPRRRKAFRSAAHLKGAQPDDS